MPDDSKPERMSPLDPLRQLFETEAATDLPAVVRERVQARLNASLALLNAGETSGDDGSGEQAVRGEMATPAQGGPLSAPSLAAGTAPTGALAGMGVVGALFTAAAVWWGASAGSSPSSLLVRVTPMPQAASHGRDERQASDPLATEQMENTTAILSTGRADESHRVRLAPRSAGKQTDAEAFSSSATSTQSLIWEVRLLRKAQSLATSDRATARKVLNEYAAQFPSGKLMKEALQLNAALDEQEKKAKTP